MLRHRSQRRRLGLDRPVPAGSPAGVGGPRTTDLRAFLNAIFVLAANRLPVAPATPRVSAPGHRLPLLSCLERSGLQADENRMGAPTTRPMQGGKYFVFYEANVRTNTKKNANPTRSYDQRISQIHEPHSRESLRNSQKIYEFRRFLNEEVRTIH
jgi:hypothetical protein